MVSLPTVTKLLIGGAWCANHSERTFPSINPADGSVLAEIAEASEKDVDRAVAAARTALDPWWRMGPSERGRRLLVLAELVEQHSAEIAHLETLDCGKPISESSRSDVPKAIECLMFFSGAADKIYGDAIPINGALMGMVLREPYGVVAQIVPWNFPILLAVWKLAPALAAGNTIVLKPSLETSLSALRLGELIIQADFPPGTVNIVTGPGETTGRALVGHPDVDKIAFTGSTAVGQEIIRSSAQAITPLSLELGGKGANIVFADADLEAAVNGAVKGAFANQGQICFSGSRLFLQDAIYREFVERLIERTLAIRQGNPMDASVSMGPQVSQAHWRRILDYIEIGKNEGAMLVCGGGRPPDQKLAKGFYIQPTVFANVDNSMRIAQEEIFGPVLSVISFKDEADAVSQANNTRYGLSAGIWTRDITRAHRVAQKVRAGTAWVNCFNKTHPAIPFGGHKMSGYGRDNGMECAFSYTQTKSVWINLE